MPKVVRRAALIAAAFIMVSAGVMAQQLSVDVNRISSDGVGEKIGTIGISETKKGVAFKVSVKGIPAGPHGFHVHEKGDCGPGMKDGKMTAGIAAGDHYDPEGTKTHQGPKGKGHKGDLPVLNSKGGTINQTVTASRLKMADVKGRSLIIHEGGDTYSDKPESGGGKGRIACAVVPS
jgi:Cu-Zn family superoxide dismutase